MKLTITGGLLEHLRDALDDVVEGNAPALVGMDLAKATLEIEERDFAAALLSSRPADLPTITITSADRQEVARYRARDGQWERLHSCDECDAEEWSEHSEWSCNCVVEPARDDPDYRDD